MSNSPVFWEVDGRNFVVDFFGLAENHPLKRNEIERERTLATQVGHDVYLPFGLGGRWVWVQLHPEDDSSLVLRFQIEFSNVPSSGCDALQTDDSQAIEGIILESSAGYVKAFLEGQKDEWTPSENVPNAYILTATFN